jgi:tetraacyldisaccharide-1-P 4'-kinase
MIFEASWDLLKGKSWHDTERHKFERVMHMLKHIHLTGTEMVCKRNGDLVRDGIFLYENCENVWFISRFGAPPKLSSSLEELGFFPKATQALSDDHADFSRNRKRISFSSVDLHSHVFDLVAKSS